MNWDQPVFDRDIQDILERNSKAFFNVADWIRINGNTQYVNAIVNVLRVLSLPYTELSEPSISTIPTAEEINEFVKNIDVIREAVSFPENTGMVELKTEYSGGLNEVLDYNTINDWERDLELIKTCILTAANWTVGCGLSTVGQSRFWQVRFRLGNFAWPVDDPVRRGRCGVGISGSGLKRQNKFRRYAAP